MLILITPNNGLYQEAVNVEDTWTHTGEQIYF